MLKSGTAFVQKIIDNRLNILALLWLIGTAVLLLINLIGYIRLIIKMRKNSVVVSCPELMNFTDKRVMVRVWENTSSPFMTGIFKPSLVLPARELTEEQLNNILRHEMTHFKRHDILYKWFMSLVKCVHWFNPVIWYVSKQINTECEISCDMAVTQNMNRAEEMSYIDTVLALLPMGKTKQIPLTTQMASSKRILKRRFEMIRNKKKTSKFVSVLSAVIAVVMLGTTVFASGVLSDLATDDYTVEITNNGEKIELVNKPFIENGEVYLPLREIFEKVGIMNRPGSEIMWNNGEISIIRMPEEEERLNGKIGLEYRIAIGKNEVTQHIIHDVYNDMNGYSSSMWKAPLLKESVTYIPFEYSEFMLMGHGDNINIDYSVFDNNGTEKTVEVIKGMSRKLIVNEEMKIVVDPSADEQACYDSLSRFGTELENGRIEAMKQYCTDNFIKAAFYDNTFLGVKSGKLPTVNSIYLYPDEKYHVTYTFYPYPPNSANDEGQRFTAVMEKQPDGRMLIDKMLNEQKIKIQSIN